MHDMIRVRGGGRGVVCTWCRRGLRVVGWGWGSGWLRILGCVVYVCINLSSQGKDNESVTPLVHSLEIVSWMRLVVVDKKRKRAGAPNLERILFEHRTNEHSSLLRLRQSDVALDELYFFR